jgi:hypothetical protein
MDNELNQETVLHISIVLVALVLVLMVHALSSKISGMNVTMLMNAGVQLLVGIEIQRKW